MEFFGGSHEIMYMKNLFLKKNKLHKYITKDKGPLQRGKLSRALLTPSNTVENLDPRSFVSGLQWMTMLTLWGFFRCVKRDRPSWWCTCVLGKGFGMRKCLEGRGLGRRVYLVCGGIAEIIL